MIKFLFFQLNLLFITSQFGKMYYDAAQFNINPIYASNFSFVTFNDSQGDSRFNMSGYQTCDLLKVMNSGELVGKSNAASKDYDRKLLKINLNTCNVSKGLFGNFIIRMISDNLEKHSNYRFVCPQKKNFYYAINFPVVDDKYFPTQLLGHSFYWRVSFIFKGKVPNVRSLVHLFSIRLDGHTVW